MSARRLKDQNIALLDVTRKGPVTKWSDRMAEIASMGGIPIEAVNWFQSPRDVAYEVVILFKNNDKLPDLIDAINQYRYEKNDER